MSKKNQFKALRIKAGQIKEIKSGAWVYIPQRKVAGQVVGVNKGKLEVIVYGRGHKARATNTVTVIAEGVQLILFLVDNWEFLVEFWYMIRILFANGEKKKRLQGELTAWKAIQEAKEVKAEITK